MLSFAFVIRAMKDQVRQALNREYLAESCDWKLYKDFRMWTPQHQLERVDMAVVHEVWNEQQTEFERPSSTFVPEGAKEGSKRPQDAPGADLARS